ncbi:Endonuclease, Uma2 family (restriction endonuclease fold) [Pseudonocardia ammonioxydans]|uniref:Endonuclease, Uma2 family (Restriction endonuclease fold) n=2 Tax=Pseudonocardia ammonioxydans TaxID=260086 RepID=A0A1I5FE55_PSUAM|nr:Endonuclease, Uma2 family (restriction endonuclease fold) [Pseudonocardia ammonioxydans]
MLEAPQAMLEERRRLGLDHRDEMWDGVLHVVPPAGGPHQRLSTRLTMTLGPLAERHGLVPHMETGLFRAATDYRVPDQSYCRPEHLSERGTEGAELVVEVRSAGDETYDKIDFYAAAGVRELLVVHPGDRRAEVFRSVGGRLLPVQATGGVLGLETLEVELRTGAGVLHLTWDDGSAEI